MFANFNDEFTLAKRAAEEAGKILIDSFGRAGVYGKAVHDIGTEPEVVAENHIKKLIQHQYPEHNVWGEETGLENRSSETTWIIDPLDGTRNYLLGVPYFSVSIALQVERDIIFGLVYNPYTLELAYAKKGEGAFWGDKRFSTPRKNTMLADAIVCSDWGGSEEDEAKIHRGIRNLEKLIFASRSVVVHFSPALDLCQIALGRADALVTLSTEVEDHAAGSLIVQEAGGVVTNVDSETWDFSTRGIIAANSNVIDEIKALLKNPA